MYKAELHRRPILYPNSILKSKSSLKYSKRMHLSTSVSYTLTSEKGHDATALGGWNSIGCAARIETALDSYHWASPLQPEQCITRDFSKGFSLPHAAEKQLLVLMSGAHRQSVWELELCQNGPEQTSLAIFTHIHAVVFISGNSQGESDLHHTLM